MKSPAQKTLLGYGLMLLCDILWVTSGAAVQALERNVPDFQLGILRYVGGVLCAAVLMCLSRTKLELPGGSYVYAILMGFCSMGFNCFYFFPVSILPLSHVSLELVCVMIMVSILSKILFDKTQNFILKLSIFGSTLGMMFLIQPWKDFNHGFTLGFIASPTNHNITAIKSTANQPVVISSGMWLLFGYLSLIGSALLESFYVILAGVYLKNVKAAPLTFVTSGVAIPMCLICSFYLEQPVLIIDPYTILLVSLHVIGTGTALLCQVAGCQLISPIHSVLIGNLVTVLNLFLQYTIMGDALYGRRNVLEAAGCVLVVVSITVSGLFNNEEKHEDF